MSVTGQFIRDKFDTLLVVSVFLIVLTLWNFTGRNDDLLQLARDFGTAILVLTGVRRLTQSPAPETSGVQATATLSLDRGPTDSTEEKEGKKETETIR